MPTNFTLQSHKYTEHDCQKAVIQYLELLKNQTHKLNYVASLNEFIVKQQMNRAKNAGMRKGWPDLMIFLEGGTTVFFELKLHNGTLSVDQRKVHRELRISSFPVHVVRADTPYKMTNEICRILREDYGFKEANP